MYGNQLPDRKFSKNTNYYTSINSFITFSDASAIALWLVSKSTRVLLLRKMFSHNAATTKPLYRERETKANSPIRSISRIYLPSSQAESFITNPMLSGISRSSGCACFQSILEAANEKNTTLSP